MSDTQARDERGSGTEEREARDRAFLASGGFTVAEGRLWNKAWDAARKFYVEQRAESPENGDVGVPSESKVS